MEIGGIRTIEGVHERAEIRLRGLRDEMVVVCQKNESMKDNTILAKGIPKIGEELLIICTGKKDLFPLISSCGDMVEGTFLGNPKGSCHGQLQYKMLPIILSDCLSSVKG